MNVAQPVSDSPSNDANLCAPFVAALHVTGASVTVFGPNRTQSTICATDPVAARGDAIQFELGEGPHWQALAMGLPVLCSDLASAPREWPMFAAAAQEIGMGAVFAFPMTMGAVVVGAVDLYSGQVRFLDPHQVSVASSMAGRIAARAVHRATQSANDPVSTEHGMAPALRREVHQATGMIQAQLDTNATEAFARLKAHAFSSGRSMEDIARDVIGRRLDFAQFTD